MTKLFGVPMNGIMIALLIVLTIAFSTIGWVVLRNRVMFLIGVRNIPRRRAQTILIVIGLMLSTLIISAAFSIGDTVNYSITNQTFERLHRIDEIVQARAGSTDESEAFAATSLISPLPIPQAQADQFVQAFKTIPGVEGAASVVRAPVPATNPKTGVTKPRVVLTGADPAQTAGFTDIESADGRQLSLADLAPDEIYVNESTADALDLRKGDPIQVIAGGRPAQFTVKDIVKDRVLTGAILGETKGLALSLARAQQLLNRTGQVDFIAVSNTGGVRGGLAESKSVTKALNEKLDQLAGAKWQADETKQSLVDAATSAASNLTAFFVVLGLFSIASGMLLIFLIFVMLAAERKVEMGMARAVGTKRRHLTQMFMSEGMAYNVMSAAIGCTLGVAVSMVMVRVMAALFSAFDLAIVFHVTPRSLIVSYSLGVVLTFVTVTFSSWRISGLNIVSAIRDISDAASKRAGFWWLLFSVIFVLAGPALAMAGWSGGQLFPFTFGVTLITLGLALLGRYLGAPSRPAFTAMGLFLLVFWLLGAGDRLPVGKHLEGGIEMFFLSGIAMVTAATFVVVYNADLLLGLLALSGGVFSHLIPSIRTAVAYPLANKFRTGMTIAMISLVVFALVMMSTMNSNFSRIFLSKDALGGYDVQVSESPSNPIADLNGALQQRGFDTSAIVHADAVKLASSRVAEVRMEPTSEGKLDDFARYQTLRLSDSFIRNNGVRFQARAEGLDTDAAVWQSIAAQPDEAVIDAFAIPGHGFRFGGPRFSLKGIRTKDTTFKPIKIQVRDAATGAARDVKIVGIISTKASATFFGLWLAPQAFDAVYAQPEQTIELVKLAPGTDAKQTAKNIEKALSSEGVQAQSLRKIIDDNQALNRGFLYLIQGFMGLGLFVGIAAVGVIAFRLVVERRQQIGMLRAIGYTRGAVALSFVMESSFIALLGIFSGISLGLLLAFQLVTSDEFAANGLHGFYIPWVQILGIGAFAFVASLLMTIVPSRQASSIPIAEALRYE